MKLTDSDIISAARDLRDAQNEHLSVQPSPLKRNNRPTPLWWAATAAALVFGLLLGRGLSPLPREAESLTSLESHTQPHPSLTGEDRGRSAEPAIIREVIHQVVHDTIYETRIVRVPVHAGQMQTAQTEPTPAPGCSMLCDDIRYDLLAGN